VSPGFAAAEAGLGLIVLFFVARPRVRVGGLAGGEFTVGLATGLAGMAAIELVAVLAGGARLQWSPPADIALSGLTWVMAALLVAAAQEGWVRGWLLRKLAARWGFGPAAIATTALFVALHGGAYVLAEPVWLTLLGVAGLSLFGLTAALSVQRTGGLAWAIGAHAGWDFTQGFVLGAPSYGRPAEAGSLFAVLPTRGSGWIAGAGFGPEASPLAVVLLALAMVLWLRQPCRARPSH
jgi:membrane protease YdiL (CAAX protease family)